MRKWPRALYARYEMHHEATGRLLDWMGVIGAVAFPLLYLLRETHHFPVMYDDLAWRGAAVFLCVVLALRKWWPEPMQRFYLAYSYVSIFYCLAFLLPFSLMHNKATTPAVANIVLSVVLIILLTDWRNTIAMLAGGYLTSATVYWLTADAPSMPIDFILWWMPLCGVLVASGSAARYAEKRAELERMRTYASLAGSIAHELRTPLAQVQHVLRRIDAEVPAASEASRAVQQGHAAIHRCLQSINITLQQVRGAQPVQTELGWLWAARSVGKAIDEYAYDSVNAQQRVRLNVEQDFAFRGEVTTFELLLFNLLKNSLYYLPLHPDMEVCITVRAAPSPCILVHDTGPGIEPELLDHLFKGFKTLGKIEGTGLGLPFCRRVMRSFGGDIQCRSELGRFTEFTLHFPRCPAPGVLPADLAAMPVPAGRTVLIVDDQCLNRTVARALARDLGLEVLEAEHGQQALDMLQAGTVPDVVLMDVNMPGLDGMATTRHLRALPGPAARVPVYALTANDSPSVRAAAREAGMQGVLAKPIDVEALRLALGVGPRRQLPHTSSHSLRV